MPLVAVMLGAIATTKFPILLGRGYWFVAGPATGMSGFWDMAHEVRTDLAMLMNSVFLVLVGAGPWSIDARRSAHRG